MSGGLHGKLGIWHEQDFVCLMWLRLLGESVESVEWESRDPENERGVDVWTEEQGRRIAYQVKKRDTGNWAPSDLVAAGILKDARSQLERKEGRAEEFWFVTTAAAPDLGELHAWAMRHGSVEELSDDKGCLKGPGKLAKALLGDELNAACEENLRNLAGRVHVWVQNEPALEKSILNEARLHAGDDGETLVSALLRLRKQHFLGRTWHKSDLLAELSPSHITWRHGVDSKQVWEQAEELRERFVDDTRGRRSHRYVAIQRPETQELEQLLTAAESASTILVHGAAGSGKSDVLASAVDKWPVDRDLVVAILADEVDRLAEVKLTVEKLVSVAGLGRLTLVLDQLDQVVLAGREGQRKLAAAKRLVQDVRESGGRVVIGCRTVDANGDTQLHGILSPPTARVEKLLVGELPEDAVSEVLVEAGLAWTTLGAEARRLARRPVGLNMILDLVERDRWRGAQGLPELIKRWLHDIIGDDQSMRTALAAVVACVEQDGLSWIDSNRLGFEHKDGIEALEAAGVLQVDSRSRLRPVHQVVFEAELARRLGDADNLDDVRERLGQLGDQDVHDARRLRVAASLFVNKGLQGILILDGLFRSDQVRPILKRAMLLGLAAQDEPLLRGLIQIVEGWLDEGLHVELVCSVLLRGHGAWMTACRSWLEGAWSESDSDRSDLLLGLAASVGAQRGDLVADLLTHWGKTSEGVLDRARLIFTQDPSEDSDKLFELRLQAMPEDLNGWPSYFSWPDLLEANPERAARYWGRILSLTNDDLSRFGTTTGQLLPNSEDFPDSALEAAGEFWVEARTWWLGLADLDLHGVDPDDGQSHGAALVDVVEILARCLAHLLGEEQFSWDELVDQLPERLREIDGWLLLRVGCNMDERSIEAIRGAAEWIAREEHFAILQLGWNRAYGDLSLIQAFAKTLGAHLPDEDLEAFEAWVLGYRDPWSAEHERCRFELSRESGVLLPTSQGAVALFVLEVFPEHRLGLLARRRLLESQRKFGAHREALFGPRRVSGGRAVSTVPDDEASRWTNGQWLDQLRSVENSSGVWKQLDARTVAVLDRSVLLRQLNGLARNEPVRYFELARFLAEEEFPFKEGTLAGLLRALGDATPASGHSAVADSDLADLVCNPSFLGAEASIDALCHIVETRAALEWPAVVVERLVEIASGSSERMSMKGLSSDEDPMEWDRSIDQACQALDSLMALARHHEHLHQRLLDAVEPFIGEGPPARRANASLLALVCSKSEPARGQQLFLKGCEDPDVASSRRCGMGLMGLATDETVIRAVADRAQDTLVGLVGQDVRRQAERGGHAVVALFARGVVSPQRLHELAEEHPLARKGMALELGYLFMGTTTEPWTLEFALKLADDAEEEVGNTIIDLVARSENSTLLRDGDFASRLVQTAAGRRQKQPLLRALDRETNLAPLAQVIFEYANHVIAGTLETVPPWERFEDVRKLGDLFARLVEESEREEDWDLRREALDKWDALVLARPGDPAAVLDAVTDLSRM